jgi:hypothetical protein
MFNNEETLDVFMQFHLIENIVWNKNKAFGFTMWMEPNYGSYVCFNIFL